MGVGLSMIVRDAINELPDLFRLAIPAFPEIVVYCTGSTDGTWEMLRSIERERFPKFRCYLQTIPFDAKHFHFGHARTMAAHLNSRPYVMMLDADERMSIEDMARIQEVPRHMGDCEVASFPRHNWLNPPHTDGPKELMPNTYPDTQLRLIRNDRTVSWRRPVHESCLVGADGRQPKVFNSNLHIEHYHHYYRTLRKDTWLFDHIYLELAASDSEWVQTYPIRLLPSPNTRESAVNRFYMEDLGRPADKAGLAAWVSSEYSVTEIRQHIRMSAEYKKRQENKREGK